MGDNVSKLIELLQLTHQLRLICDKILDGERISDAEAIDLFNCPNLALLGILAGVVKKRQSGNYAFFNKNFHVEPTNICVNNCKFCSYRRKQGQEGAWDCSIDDIVEIVRKQVLDDVTEIHIVGGVHPDHDIFFYTDMLKAIRTVAPHLHIKAFTAVEIDQMCKKAGMDYDQGLNLLKDAGLNSIPGGGAEIFDEVLREEICPGKTSSANWLKIHEMAHQAGIPSNATMLYGLKESYKQRVDHLGRLRKLQDKTHGFNTFIPLKFRKANNQFSTIEETTIVEDMKNYAVSRIYLDNIPHLKAYWPMIGKQAAQLSLSFGVDDLDGTIDDSTRIYSMAGSEEQNPVASTSELTEMIKQADLVPVLRDSLYNIIEVL
jgi:aminodeoxyfutalosine synthase